MSVAIVVAAGHRGLSAGRHCTGCCAPAFRGMLVAALVSPAALCLGGVAREGDDVAAVRVAVGVVPCADVVSVLVGTLRVGGRMAVELAGGRCAAPTVGVGGG